MKDKLEAKLQTLKDNQATVETQITKGETKDSDKPKLKLKETDKDEPKN